jgi:uncharacterized protein (DUF1684 family)
MGKILMKKSLVISCWLLVAACSTKPQPTAEQIEAHQKEVQSWFSERITELKDHNGWLNIAGLYWLKEGMNSFGSDEGNDLVFPAGKIDPKAGYFLVKGQQVTMMPAPGFDLKEAIVFHPDSSNTILQNHGSLEWFIIRREDKLGVRLRDLESDNVKNFEGIDRYPVEYSWKVPAKFEQAKEGETINITNVLGQTMSQPLAGRFVFEVDGTEHRLSATGKKGQLFIVFADSTNGKETYGAGRFLYPAEPDSLGNAFLDFNKSENPPCAFTEFATCPLPPKENILPVGILAGEKNFEHNGKQASHTL